MPRGFSCATRLRRCAIPVATLAALFLSPALIAQQRQVSEYEVKATYLYNFLHFVQWPENAPTARSNAFLVCVLGQDPFGPVLDAALAGETVQGKKVAAKRISKPQDAVDCRILFISSSEERQLKDILAGLGKSGVLTVSDLPEFSRRGGMIQFRTEEGRIRFEVNLQRTAQAGLTLSSQLLKVAVSVTRTAPPGN